MLTSAEVQAEAFLWLAMAKSGYDVLPGTSNGAVVVEAVALMCTAPSSAGTTASLIGTGDLEIAAGWIGKT